MSLQQPFANSFYSDNPMTTPSNFIFDDVYRSASFKHKYGADPKYSYYNALLDMKHKMSQNQSSVYNDIFSAKPKYQESHPPHYNSKVIMPIYHVEKINKMKFKVYKNNVGRQLVDRLPITDLSFQIRLKGQSETQQVLKPRLQQILSQYRKINHSGRNRARSTNQGNSSQFNVRLMTKTVTKLNKNQRARR